VNAALRLAELVEPDGAWRIVTSDEHSTVWDGDRTLFDMQFSALDIDPEECFRLALHEGIMLPIGEYMILPSPQRL
jgi:hypothetical protein